jgi:hypothetical protein
MNKFLYILILSSVLYSACEDPFDAQLADADPQLVVDAWLTNEDKPQIIKLTLSQPYLQNTFAEGVSDAVVTVSSSAGNTYNFDHIGNGRYQWTPTAGNTIGNIGDDYTLNIVRGAKQYSAVSTMNVVPVIDSIMQEFRDDEIFADDGIYCQFFARDFPGIGNTYWIKTFRNDTFLNKAVEFNIAYDAAFDSGAEVDGVIFITPIRELINPVDNNGIPTPWLPGDRIRVEIHSITLAAFDYMEILRDQLLNSLNGIFAEPLANPTGNIQSDNNDDVVLGMFNVAAVSAIEEVIN